MVQPSKMKATSVNKQKILGKIKKQVNKKKALKQKSANFINSIVVPKKKVRTK